MNLTSQSHPLTLLLTEVLTSLSSKFPAVKFLRIGYKAAIENWPEGNLPTVFCYRYGELQKQMIGEAQVGGKYTTPERVEWRLKLLGPLKELSEMAEDGPEKVEKVRKGEGSENDDD